MKTCHIGPDWQEKSVLSDGQVCEVKSLIGVVIYKVEGQGHDVTLVWGQVRKTSKWIILESGDISKIQPNNDQNENKENREKKIKK